MTSFDAVKFIEDAIQEQNSRENQGDSEARIFIRNSATNEPMAMTLDEFKNHMEARRLTAAKDGPDFDTEKLLGDSEKKEDQDAAIASTLLPMPTIDPSYNGAVYIMQSDVLAALAAALVHSTGKVRLSAAQLVLINAELAKSSISRDPSEWEKPSVWDANILACTLCGTKVQRSETYCPFSVMYREHEKQAIIIFQCNNMVCRAHVSRALDVLKRTPTYNGGPRSLNRCAGCGITEEDIKLTICQGCRLVHYCKETCHVEHWPEHRKECKKDRSHVICDECSAHIPRDKALPCAHCTGSTFFCDRQCETFANERHALRCGRRLRKTIKDCIKGAKTKKIIEE